jgi:hypothetical protein
MAVSVDRVYQTVLALANKEQRGYITPQEFNLFANHAQNEIFEQYFYDLNQFLRIPSNKTVTSDPRDIIEEKISAFRVTNQNIQSTIPNNVHKLEGVCVCYKNAPASSNYSSYSSNGDVYVIAEELSNNTEMKAYSSSRLAGPSFNRPVFIRTSGEYGELDIRPAISTGIDKVQIDYIKKPASPNWTYVVVNNKALWNPAAPDMRHFDLHGSEEKNLVAKILALSGLAIKDMDLAQTGAGKEAFYIQQEKA